MKTKPYPFTRLLVRTLPSLTIVFLLSGCAALSASSGIISMAGAALEAAGLKKPADAPFEIALSLHPGKNLNEVSGNAAAVVTKIYHLKNIETWSRLSMEQLISDEATKAALGDDLIATREVTLLPGRPYETTEKVPNTASYLGIATLFHSPAPNRWKYAFDAEEAEDTGIVIGVHACAMSVPTGIPSLREDLPKQDPASLAFVQCG